MSRYGITILAVGLFVASTGQVFAKSGQVMTPDGDPAMHARVLVYSRSQIGRVENGELHDGQRGMVRADAQGGFQFTPPGGAYALFVSHESGYAELTQAQFQKSSVITLTLWAQIDGTLFTGSQPGAGEWAGLRYLDRRLERGKPRLHYHYGVQTDSQGQFRFDRVMAGKVNVHRMIVMQKGLGGTSTKGPSHPQYLTLKPGQVAKVKLGGTGRPVTGLMQAPPSVDWFKGVVNITQQANVAPVRFPDLAGKSPEEIQALLKKQSERMRAERENRPPPARFIAPVAGDGKFHADDIPSGTYTVQIELHGENAAPNNPRDNVVAKKQMQITVPEMPGGRSDEALDLGTILAE